MHYRLLPFIPRSKAISECNTRCNTEPGFCSPDVLQPDAIKTGPSRNQSRPQKRKAPVTTLVEDGRSLRDLISRPQSVRALHARAHDIWLAPKIRPHVIGVATLFAGGVELTLAGQSHRVTFGAEQPAVQEGRLRRHRANTRLSAHRAVSGKGGD